MYVSRLRLRNWKNFNKADARLRLRTFIIGPNASGKSNLLDALRFLRDVAKEGLREAVEQRGGVSALRCLSARAHSDVEIEVTISGDDDLARWRYALSFNQNSSKQPMVKGEIVDDLSRETKQNLLTRPDSDDESDEVLRTQTSLEQIVANREFREIQDFFSGISYRHIIPQVVRDPAGFTAGPVENDPFGRDFVVGLSQTSPRTRDAWLKRIVKVLQVAVPQLLDLELDAAPGEAPHLVVRYAHWRPHPARQSEAQLSDGTLRLLGLLWAMFESEGPLLLEEPELSLNAEIVRHLPELFEQIRREIRDMRRTRGAGRRQIVLSTHSRDLLSGSGVGAEEVIWLEPTVDGTAVHWASKGDRDAFLAGLTAADVLLPKTTPSGLEQLLIPFAR